MMQEIQTGLRFMSKLPGFLRQDIEPQTAKAILQNRLQNREARFLAIVKECIYALEKNPYLALLKHIGCEFEDLKNLVEKDGLEEALTNLLHQGVYLTVDEYKGRKPILRNNLHLTLSPGMLQNPRSALHIPVKSSGSRSAGTPMMISLEYISDCAVNACLMFENRDGSNWIKADWEVPGGGALFRLLKFSSFGKPPERWFSQVDPASPGIHPRYRWSAHALRWGSLMARKSLPKPQYVPLDNPLPIVDWMTKILSQNHIPCLFTFPSSALILSKAAYDAGISLKGASFLISGEPITDARIQAITKSGAAALPRYGSIECGPIAYGCINPRHSDDLHINSDLHALIQAGEHASTLGIPKEALFITTLCHSAPFIFLNVSLGDQAILDDTTCGCSLESTGWKHHISQIRSYEKLTGAGMTFLDTDVIRILEEVLPSTFGGSPTDYQLIEEESDTGNPMLRLIVNPELEISDEEVVKRTFLEHIGRGSDASRIMSLTWMESNLLQIERQVPRSTQSGKILHFYLNSPKISR